MLSFLRQVFERQNSVILGQCLGPIEAMLEFGPVLVRVLGGLSYKVIHADSFENVKLMTNHLFNNFYPGPPLDLLSVSLPFLLAIINSKPGGRNQYVLVVTTSSLRMNLGVIDSNAPSPHVNTMCLLLFETFYKVNNNKFTL